MPILIKNAAQIDGIRKSSHLARRALFEVAPLMREGVTTRAIEDKIIAFIKSNNAKAATLNYKGYPSSCCISVNDVVCHGIPGSQILLNGDILNVDVTTILNGYFGDTSMMFTVGDISPEAQRLINVTKRCMDIGIAQCLPGNYIGNIGYYIAEYAH